MAQRKSLKFKLIWSFILIVVPLFLFLYVQNYYSMKVVQDQSKQSNGNLLQVEIQRMDRILDDTGKYLMSRATYDKDINSLNLYPFDHEEYQMTKVRIVNRFREDTQLYNSIDTFFVYSIRDKDLTVSQGDYRDFAKLGELLEQRNAGTGYQPWQVVGGNGRNALVKWVDVNPDVIIGAWVYLSSISHPFQTMNFGENGGIFISDSNGNPLTEPKFVDGQTIEISKMISGSAAKPDEIASDRLGDYFVMKANSEQSGVSLVLLIPEEDLLKKLPSFQIWIYLIPVGLIIALFFYLFMLKLHLFLPLSNLIKGMRRITQGDLSIRVKESGSNELLFLSQTFNDMVGQIENLRIDVYEEKIRVQKAEFQHLQVQIKPHFYLNSLNIIYNLAILQDYGNIQKMSLHLADYFRYTIRTDQAGIPLREELQHVRNYLEIQKLRFPRRLSFEILVSDAHLSLTIPPLSLQTFVENCMIHGMNNGKPSFHINISSSSIDKDDVEIMIHDNGSGFSLEQLADLNSSDYMQLSRHEHIGIWNVNRRLSLYYGGNSELGFENGDGGGAIVRIKLFGASLKNSEGERDV